MHGRPGVVGGGGGKSKMFRIWKLDIACNHLTRRRMTSSTSTRVREVDQGVTKKGVEFWINRLSSYLHRSIANPATQKSTELNLGLKKLRWLTMLDVLNDLVVDPPSETFCLQALQRAYLVSLATEKNSRMADVFLDIELAIAVIHVH